MAKDSDSTIVFDGKRLSGKADMALVDFLEAHDIDLPHDCYHSLLGPLETCDSCWVEIGGEFKRGCTLHSQVGLTISSQSAYAVSARHEGMDRLLSKHELYCTVCENNTGNCTMHNTMAELGIPIQRYEFQRKLYEKDTSSPLSPTIPTSASSAGAA